MKLRFTIWPMTFKFHPSLMVVFFDIRRVQTLETLSFVPVTRSEIRRPMSANVRRVQSTVQVHYHHTTFYSSKIPASQSFDFLYQFLPFASCPCSHSLSSVNPNERRKIAVGLSKIIKSHKGYVLKGFSRDFSPSFLVKIMKLLGTRETAFAFFRLAFRDDSDPVVRSCCVAAHILAAGNLRFLAQDVVSCVIARIGPSRSREMVEFMWAGHSKYEPDFSILDTLMRGFTNAEMGNEALEIVSRMREVGLRPSSSAVCVLVKLLLRIGDYCSVWKLFRDMVRKGPRPSNYIFSMLILGFCRKGFVRIGESLLHVMRKFHCEPDVFAYNIVIRANCVRGQTAKALEWMCLMSASGCKPSIVTFNTVVDALCKEGNVVEARRVFDGLCDRGLYPNTIIYNTMMNGYVKARDIRQANLLFEEMRSKGIVPDGITFNILLSGHYKYGREEDGDRFLRDLSITECSSYSSFYDISIVVLCWAGKLDEAKKLLESMLEKGFPLSVVSFNTIIAAYSRAGLEEKAYEAYRIMMRFGISPSSSTSSSLIMGLSKKGKLIEARELFYKKIEERFPIDKVAFTVLLDGYFRMGDVNGGRSLWSEMVVRGMFPDAVAFAAFINGLSKVGLVDEAYEELLEMSRKGLVPNNFVYNSLIRGFCNSGKLDEALKLKKVMNLKGLLPDIYTANMIINGFCKQGRMKSAINAFMEMGQNGLKPDIVTFNTLFGGYCKAFDTVSADQIVNKMYASGWNPDMTTYNISLHGFCSIGKINHAVKMLDELVWAGFVPNTVTYNTLLNGALGDRQHRALILTAKLLKMAFFPNVVTINLLMSHFCKKGMPERALIWGQNLSEISFDFDEITYKILARAYRHIGKNVDVRKGTSSQSVFLESLMYITYVYFLQNKPFKEESQNPLMLIESSCEGSC